MQNILRGCESLCERASGAAIDSRKGRAMATAEPRRKRRRETGRRLDAKGELKLDVVSECMAGPSYLFRNSSL